jgi:hypothetical protein
MEKEPAGYNIRPWDLVPVMRPKQMAIQMEIFFKGGDACPTHYVD